MVLIGSEWIVIVKTTKHRVSLKNERIREEGGCRDFRAKQVEEKGSICTVQYRALRETIDRRPA